jgi:hypothetical protein
MLVMRLLKISTAATLRSTFLKIPKGDNQLRVLEQGHSRPSGTPNTGPSRNVPRRARTCSRLNTPTGLNRLREYNRQACVLGVSSADTIILSLLSSE